MICFFYPGENSEALLRSHFSAETKAALAAKTGYRFTPVLLWRDYECLIGAVTGMVVILWRRRWGLLFPAVLFGSALLIHQFHRPFWWYYHLHFAIPMAWLSAIASKELLDLLWHWQWPELKSRPVKPALLLLAWSSLTSLLVVGAFDKIQVGLESISHREAIRDNEMVEGLLAYRDRTRWVFADRAIYAFHAGLPIPPELAVIPSKRIWSGQISPALVLERLEHYQPELILLTSSSRWAEELSDFLDREYVAVAGSRLYVSKKMEGTYGRKETFGN